MTAKAQGEAPAMAIAPVPVELPLPLPRGFRFNPTDDELVNYYLRRKIHGLHVQVHDIVFPEVDVYKFEPWELPDKSFSLRKDDPGAKEECYLFSPRGRKYANGFRMNRATCAGYWKSTGKDRRILQVGMKKTLVYHLGRAPKGVRTDWVMHEYRLVHHNEDSAAIQDTHALCRVFKKKAMAPSPVVPGGAEPDKEGMQSVPGGANAYKDDPWMQSMFGGGDSSMQSMFGSGDTDMDDSWMKSMFGGGDSSIWFVPGGSDADKDDYWMQSLFGGGGTNMEAAWVYDGAAGDGQEEDEE